MTVPGWAARRRHRAFSLVLVVAGVVVPILVLLRVALSERSWVALGLDPRVMSGVAWAAGLALVTRVASVAELWHARSWSRRRSWAGAVAVLLVLATWATLGLSTVEAARASQSVGRTFSAPLDVPLYEVPNPRLETPVTQPTIVTSTTTLPVAESTAARAASSVLMESDVTPPTLPPPKPDRPTSGIDPALFADVSTILLIGGDAGPGRWSLRTDTMMLLSVHRPSGRAALVSVPRNLERLLFPVGSAMEARYPAGFTDLANAVYPVVRSQSNLRTSYDVADGVEPGVVALAEGLGYSLDVTIDDYVLIDMRGFVNLVDALGGVSLDLPQPVQMPGNIPNAPTQYPDVVGPGVVFMDGTMALGYARSRSMDSDYQRTERQRHLLAALSSQLSVGDLLASYGAVLDAVGDSLRTSLTPDELAATMSLIGGETAMVESVGLVPPLANPRRPDWSKLARIAAEVRLALTTGIPSGW